jgi:hypothetical protein
MILSPTEAKRKAILGYIEQKIADHQSAACSAIQNLNDPAKDKLYWLKEAEQNLQAVDVLKDVLFFAHDPSSRQPLPFEPGV